MNEKRQSVSLLLYEDLCASYLNLKDKYKRDSDKFMEEIKKLESLLRKEKEKWKLKKEEKEKEK